MPSLGVFYQETIDALREENARLAKRVEELERELARLRVERDAVVAAPSAGALRAGGVMPDDLQTRVLEIRYPHIVAMASGTIAGPWREWPLVRAEAKTVLGHLEQLKEEADRLRWVVKGAHGALADSASVVVPGVLDGDIAPAIRQLTRERDEARAAAEQFVEERDEMRVELEKVLAEVARLEKERDEARREVEVLRSCNQGVSADLEAAEADLARAHAYHEQNLKEWQHKCSRLTRERDEAREKLAETNANADQMEEVLRAKVVELLADVARLTRERDEARAEVERVVEAALDLVGEYESHGGEDTHRECLEGCGCVLPQKVAALRAAAKGE